MEDPVYIWKWRQITIKQKTKLGPVRIKAASARICILAYKKYNFVRQPTGDVWGIIGPIARNFIYHTWIHSTDIYLGYLTRSIQEYYREKEAAIMTILPQPIAEEILECW